jgi:hypothetical protein
MAAILLNWTARERWLRACAVAAEAGGGAHSPETPSCAVAAALRDARVAVLGGRQDMPLSFGSVYAGSVARFLGGVLTGKRRLKLRRTICVNESAMAVTKVALDDSGTTLVVLLTRNDRPHVYEWTLQLYDAATGAPLRRMLYNPGGQAVDVCVAPDGAIFVAVGALVPHGYRQLLNLRIFYFYLKPRFPA